MLVDKRCMVKGTMRVCVIGVAVVVTFQQLAAGGLLRDFCHQCKYVLKSHARARGGGVRVTLMARW